MSRRTRTWIFVTLVAGAMAVLLRAQQRPAPRATVRSPHGSLNLPCENCHTYTAWKPIRNLPDFNHNQTRFPLRGMHTTVACAQCHTNPVFSKASTACADCHADLHRRQFGSTCEQCHSVKGWRVSLQSVQQHQNRFPLLGAHASLDCEQCHQGAATGQFKGLSTSCLSCHAKDFQTTVIDHRTFPTTCESCHTMNTWRGAKFDHSVTGFPLSGAHAPLDCASCHVNRQFKGTATACFSCHAADFNRSTNPNHVAANLPKDCAACHTTQAWLGARFDHTAFTRFPLTGKHLPVGCTQCHANGQFTGTPTDCAACHLTDFNRTTNPNHKTGGFPTACQTCHTTAGWQPASFDHSATLFPLTGAHIPLGCTQCHVNGQYSGLGTACATCHQPDYDKTASPNHKAAGFSTTCQTCHTTVSWTSATFDHSKTLFPLTGMHIPVGCNQCHTSGVFAGLSTTCSSCHLADFNKTTSPNHAASGFPNDCTMCHTTAGWRPSSFNHANTLFPLTGAHVPLGCTQCHANGVFKGTPTACFSCHAGDFNAATNPNHVQANLPKDCATCHTTTQWLGAKFDHNTLTRFPLTGLHANVACAQCHVNGRYAGTPTDCASCHLNTFNSTTNPNHKSAGFPTDCSICHSTAGWVPAKFDHAQTLFPLTGAHVPLGCSRCHSSGQFAGLSTACVSCHQANYNNTTNPNHLAAGFPTDCAVCHSTAAWTPATFDHAKTGWALTGSHLKVACANCHVGGRYAGTPTDCYSCHRAAYTAVTNPNHLAAHFPTTCETCHNTTTWTGAVFNHTWFPIYSGSHAGKWTSCTDCHTNPADYVVFSCITCHQHDKARADADHTGVRNYVYTSTSCYTCHPTGTH